MTNTLDDTLIGTGALARLLALTPQRVNQLAAAGVIAKTGRGRYSLGPAVRGYVGYLAGQPRMDGSSGTTDYREERTRLVSLQADLAQLQLEKERGEVVPIDRIVEGVSDCFGAARAKLLALPSKLATSIAPDDPATAFKILSKGVREVLIELSEEAVAEIAKMEGAK